VLYEFRMNRYVFTESSSSSVEDGNDCSPDDRLLEGVTILPSTGSYKQIHCGAIGIANNGKMMDRRKVYGHGSHGHGHSDFY
jgi:hypothetical protein